MKHFGIFCLILLWTMPLLSSSRLELRIVLLGKSGAGKSATGNTILGKKVFEEDSTFDSVTTVSRNESGRVFGRQVTVVDTPGLFDTSKTPDELKSEIEKCVSLSVPGPHVFLLVIRLGVRFTEEERNAVKWIQENFGKRAAKFTMVLFTHVNQLKGKSVEDNFNKDIRNIIENCGGGYHSFHNLEQDGQTQVEELLKKIDAMLEKNNGEYYINKMYQEAQSKMREEEERKRQEEEEERKEYEKKRQEEEENRKEYEKKIKEVEEERKEYEKKRKEEEENRKEYEKKIKEEEEERKEYEKKRKEEEENRKEYEKKRKEVEEERKEYEKKRKEEEEERKEYEKRKEEERKDYERKKQEEFVKKVGAGFGVVVGAAVGLATVNPVVGVAVGGAAGAVAGYVVTPMFTVWEYVKEEFPVALRNNLN